MRRQAGLLLEAVERYTNEDENRLTEVFASVLQSVPALCKELFDHLGLPTAEGWEVSTQVPAGKNYVDLEILAVLREGGVQARLWAENKTWSPFRPDQLRDYRESLSGLHGQGSLIAIVPSEAVLTVPPDADATISWQTVAELIHQVGTRLSPSEWANPLAPLTPAELRLMYELIMYLEGRELAFMDNLGATDVIVAREAERVEEILRAMLQRATQQVGLQTNTDSGPRRRGFFLWQTFAPTAPNWATNLGGYPELALWPDDEWVPSEAQIEDPCFGAGYTFPPGSEFSRLQGADAADWRRSFREEHRVWVGETSGYLRLMSPLYLGELAVRGVTFDEQARALATWAQQSIRLVEERPPPAA